MQEQIFSISERPQINIGFGLLWLIGLLLVGCHSRDKPSDFTIQVSNLPSTVQEQNKKVVLAFYQQMFGDKDTAAVDKYILPTYIQHNPGVSDGATAFKKAAAAWFKGAPKTKIDVQHIAADSDLVFLHIKNIKPDGKLKSTIDIFRLENGRIAEHWDAQQDVPDQAANAHPMF
ncbi:MAG: ester cyclase [Chitinophaga sp.]|uniref:nuclear transport factor 2 family protein n=1 Tax=Chitinophaga sp. TaxID=1869181 RepID=UPI0025BEC237|nr:ester cyclase [Chitinophaga sp.]MBV8251511.1 ester cyclase [Chitinophaga sp.]